MSARLVISYWVWHYTAALPRIYAVWRNLLWFVVHFFSIPLLLRTLLAPWKRTDENFTGDLGNRLGSLIINTLSRFVGFCIRVPLILMGLASMLIMGVGLVVFYVLWLLAPVVQLLLISYGVFFLYAA